MKQKVVFLKFKQKLAKITPYYDFLQHNIIIDNASYFSNPHHSNQVTGNLILARLFNDKSVDLPNNFGVFVAQEKVQP